MEISVTDYHTAGEPFRIVTSGFPEIAGATVPDRRSYALSSPEIDAFRQLLVNEPRGHADMYGGFVVPGNDEGADLGVLFWHKDGYSTACGHGTIALGTWAVETGLVKASPSGDTDVVIDVPSGRVVARVTCSDGSVDHVAFRNVPSYVVTRGAVVTTRLGPVSADISFGGAFYASVSAASVCLSVTPSDYAELTAIGREIKWALNDTPWARHPSDSRLDGIYGTSARPPLVPTSGTSRSSPTARSTAPPAARVRRPASPSSPTQATSARTRYSATTPSSAPPSSAGCSLRRLTA
jgi:proline racemase